nr:hypothetical protein [Dictyobacter formicarum]
MFGPVESRLPMWPANWACPTHPSISGARRKLSTRRSQAYWIYRGQAQQVHTVQVPIASEEIQEAWREIRRQEQLQHALLQAEARRQEEKRVYQQQQQSSSERNPADEQKQPSTPPAKRNSKKNTNSTGTRKSTTTGAKKAVVAPSVQPSSPPRPSIPIPDPDDDEPDRL